MADRETLSAFKAEVFAPVAAWISDRIDAGELRPVPLWSVDPIVMGLAHECARRFLATGAGFPLEEATTLVREATWAMLQPDTAPGR